MDLRTCIKKLEYVGTLDFATVDQNGNPQIRNISAIHYEENAIYFYTAQGKNFYQELIEKKRTQILALTKYKEMIRFSAEVELVTGAESDKWRDLIFEEQPYLSNVYPGKTREIGAIFSIKRGSLEYFNLGVKPIFREEYSYGGGITEEKGFRITSNCIGCGTCLENCPQNAIEESTPFYIKRENCLHCGMCAKVCPVSAVQRL